MSHELVGVLGSQNDFLPDASSFHPFADPFLALTLLVAVGCVDEVAALGIKILCSMSEGENSANASMSWIFRTSIISNAVSFEHSPMKSFHALPKFMPPRHNGETCTPAVGARRRWRPKSEGGGRAAGAVMLLCWMFGAVVNRET